MAIVTAAARGLSVELFVSEVGDQSMVYHAQRSYYEALLRAGVRIYLYRAPKVLHSKHFTIDEEVAVIGSSNMDVRSFSLNMEVSVLVHGRDFVDAIRGIEDGYRVESRELQLEDWIPAARSPKSIRQSGAPDRVSSIGNRFRADGAANTEAMARKPR